MSKESPLKMNMNLVRGAAQIAKTEGSSDLAISKGATDTAKMLADGIGAVVQKRNKEFNKIMDHHLSKEGLSDEEWQSMYKDFKKRRGGYVYLNKKERMDFERDLLEEAEDKKKTEADIDEIAEIVTDEENQIKAEDIGSDTIQDIVTGKIAPTKDSEGRVGYSLSSDSLKEFVQDGKLMSYKSSWEDDRFSVSEDGKTKTDKFGNEYANNEEGFKEYKRNAKMFWIEKARETGDKMLHYNSTTGEREYLTPDEAEALLNDKDQFVTMDDIKGNIQKSAVDKNAMNAFATNITNGVNTAKNLKIGDSLDFNTEEARGRYTKIIENSDDLYKLATKNMFGNTSFQTDLTEKLSSMTYTDMGISEDVVNTLDPTPDGKVSPEDAKVITAKIMEDENMLKEYMADYFTMYEEREFKNNIPQELKDQANEDEFA